jgi:hypothetical protein
MHGRPEDGELDGAQRQRNKACHWNEVWQKQTETKRMRMHEEPQEEEEKIKGNDEDKEP